MNPLEPADAAELAPLVSQLALSYMHNRGPLPAELADRRRPGPRQVGVLVTLATSGPKTISEIASRLGMSRPHASLVIGGLVDDGLLSRRVDPADRRRVYVSLEDEVARTVDLMLADNLGPVEAFAAELGPERLALFNAQLRRLVELMSAERRDGPDG